MRKRFLGDMNRFCVQCGNALAPDIRFCTHCGADNGGGADSSRGSGRAGAENPGHPGERGSADNPGGAADRRSLMIVQKGESPVEVLMQAKLGP